MTARMRDVAERAGVSVKTVSNVINDYPHVTPATRARVEAAIADLDYRPNLGARSLRKGTYGVIALAIPDLADEYFATLAAAVARAAKRHDVALLIEQTDGDATAESLALAGLRDRLVDVVLLWPTHPATNAVLTSSEPPPARPVVLLGAFAEQAADNEALAEQAICLALERLADGTPPAPRHLSIQRAEAAGS